MNAARFARLAFATVLLAASTASLAQSRDDRGGRRDGWRDGRGDRGDRNDRDGRGARADATTSTNPYGVIVDGNIFLRDRRAAQQASQGGGPTSRPASEPLPPERALVLTGVIFEDGAFRAYFESLNGGPITRVSPGDPIARGAITEIQIGAVAYASNDRIQWIEIGHDLTGSPPAGAAGASPGMASPAPSAAPSAPMDPALMSVAERMRQRRAQERGGGPPQPQQPGVAPPAAPPPPQPGSQQPPQPPQGLQDPQGPRMLQGGPGPQGDAARGPDDAQERAGDDDGSDDDNDAQERPGTPEQQQQQEQQQGQQPERQ